MRIKPTYLAIATLICVASIAGVAQAQYVFVPDYGDGTVSVVDPATNSVVQTIVIDGTCNPGNRACPEGIVLTQAGDFAYVSLDGNSQVAMIDTATFAVTYIDLTIPGTVPALPLGRVDPLIFRRPGSDRIYVTSVAFDVNGHCGQDSGGDPDFAAYLAGAKQIAVIEGAAQVGTIDGPLLYNGTWQMGFSSDARYAYVGACNNSNFVWDKFIEIDLDAPPFGQPTRELDLSRNNVFNVAVSPNPVTPYALVPTDTGCILSVNVTTMTEVDQDALDGDPHTALCGFGLPWGTTFNAAGDRAYVNDFGSGSLATLNTIDPSHPGLISTTPVTSAGLPTELRIAGSTAFVVAAEAAYDGLPSHVIAFDLTDPDNPAQGCEIAVGDGGFNLGVKGIPGPWACDGDGGGGGDAFRRVQGSGHLAHAPKIHFHVHAQMDKKGRLKGHCTVKDDTVKPHEQIKCVDVTELTIAGDTATIRGNARHGKIATTYTIVVTDIGKPKKGGADSFSISTASGYTAGPDTLKDGDIKLKK